MFSFWLWFAVLGSAEVDLPVDRFTKKIKGFAHVKFSPPENAVKALADLDGSVFQVCHSRFYFISSHDWIII